jgi:HK97 family phage major capsid protein
VAYGQISRADALALINDQNMQEIWEEAAQTSAALRTFRKVNMGTRQAKLAVLDVLPSAPAGGAFLNSAGTNADTGQPNWSKDTAPKPTLHMGWVNKYLQAEEIAGIIPIPENVLDDAAFDIWGEVRPRVGEYIAAALDAAVFYGANAPSTWPTGGLAGQAVTAGNTLNATTYPGTYSSTDTNQAAGTARTITTTRGGDRGDLYNDLFGQVEDDGFDPNVVYMRRAERRVLRNLRSNQGELIYSDGLRGTDAVPSIWGTNIEYVRTNGLGPYSGATDVLAIAGDRSKAILGLRQDVTFKFLDQATITDGAGNVLYSLAESDMVALRFKVRVAFQIADPTTFEGGTSAFPFSVARKG